MATVMDQALVMLEGCGPEFGAGELSNHGPMAAEALVALGRVDEVEPWVERYRRRLGEYPARVAPITHDTWREALGDVNRATDWEDFFGAELDSAPWKESLETWVPLLAPGLMAAATHGIIRTAHAVRSLAAEERSAERKAELVRGLAYWAARYQVLPGSPSESVPARLPSRRLAELPIMPVRLRNPRPLNIFHAVAELDSFEPFAGAIDLAAPAEDLSAWLSDLTATMANLYLQNAGAASISYVHTVTAPSALRMMLPYLSDGSARWRRGMRGRPALPFTPAGTSPTRSRCRPKVPPERT